MDSDNEEEYQLLMPRIAQYEKRLQEVRETLAENPTVSLMERQANIERGLHELKIKRLLLRIKDLVIDHEVSQLEVKRLLTRIKELEQENIELDDTLRRSCFG